MYPMIQFGRPKSLKTKPGMGKQKGAQFERDVCKMLSLSLSNGSRDDIFWRSAMSGGRATIGSGRDNQLGDISSVGTEGFALTDRFVIECKRYKNLDLDRCLILNEGKLFDFWMRLWELSVNNKRHPLLIFQENRRPMLGLTTEEGEKELSNIVQSYRIILNGFALHRQSSYSLLYFYKLSTVKEH